MSVQHQPRVLWRPSDEMIEGATLTRFMRSLPQEFDSYDALWRWSVEDVPSFWEAIWRFFEVDGEYESVLADPRMPGAKWFPGSSLNYAAHVFRSKEDDELAIIAAGEGRALRHYSWADLREMTARVQTGLRGLGVGVGDRVVAYLPNVVEAIAAFLACAGLGAIWSSCSPDFGSRTVVDRFAQIEPKVLIAVDGYRYGGKAFDRSDVVARLRKELPTLEHTVVLPAVDSQAESEDTIPWQQLTATKGELEFEPVPFEQPLWILYSSGTTGLPKAIVQGHGGILLEQLKTQTLLIDARPGDRLFWFTTTGWMMWNFLVGVLLTDSAIVLFDGNPGYPDLDTLWDLAEEAEVTCFGASASYISSCSKAGVRPLEGRDLSKLRAIGSTGSPLSPDGFAWVYDELHKDTWLFSTSGGTDVCTAFVGGSPLLPVYEGELQCRALGCDVRAFDGDGNSVVGEVGELVIRQPMPSMPLFLWNDSTGERYRESYFEMYPDTWRHGDWIKITERGTAILSGRSDSTINRGGIRMGTAEIYRAVLALPEVSDALIVDVDGWMPLFVVLAPKAVLDQDLEAEIAHRIRTDCSPRHVPNEILEVAAVPRTLTGKILEVPVKRILQGTPSERALSRDSLSNPESIDYFVGLAQVRLEDASPPESV